jgi:hypothetical protein
MMGSIGRVGWSEPYERELISMRKVLKHYALGAVLGLLVSALSYIALSALGYGAFLVIYVSILFAQGTFYGLTAVHSRLWSTLGFVANFILWVTELVQLEHLSEGSSTHRLLYHNDSYYWLRFVLGGVLWASNKLALDFIFERTIDKHKLHAGTSEV